MKPHVYPESVKTIEAIRLANFKRLVAEIRAAQAEPMSDKAVAAAMGISAAYLSQLENGVRGAINSVAARKMEAKAKKPEGWMDTDFALWPFPDADLLARVERLNRDQRIEIQGAMRRALADLEQAQEPDSGKSSPSRGGANRQSAG